MFIFSFPLIASIAAAPVSPEVATTMFINTRSAALQLLSSLNYIGKPNNNIFKATTALGPGWRADFHRPVIGK